MAELSTIARPYAEALFRIAQSGDMAAWSETVEHVAAVVSHAQVSPLIGNPRVSHEQLYGVIASAIPSGLTAEGSNFVRTLIENDRLSAMPEIAAQFRALRNAREGAADAQIVSAFPMSDSEIADLVSTLEQRFRVRLKPSVTVDESLIGGVRVVVGDQVLDSSVRSRLEQMRIALTA